MRGLSFGFRDYAIHLFPGCLMISASLFLFFDFDWLDKDLAPLLAILFIFGGYIVGFFMDSIAAILMGVPKFKKFYWWLSGGDCLDDFFKGVILNGEPKNLKDHAAQILKRRYSERFVRSERFASLMYLMMRDIETRSDTSAAFLSRINALENMAINMGFSCFWGAIILCLNAVLNPAQALSSLLISFCGLGMGVLLLRRRMRYRSWLAKSVLRVFVSLDQKDKTSSEKEPN
ncbi:hypothetical protein [Tateyamaria sp.]|uniref:hypothetical protein n=1 Tax=Tateyamaria sp. TaxID=1929288 RepID=UPI00329AD472